MVFRLLLKLPFKALIKPFPYLYYSDRPIQSFTEVLRVIGAQHRHVPSIQSDATSVQRRRGEIDILKIPKLNANVNIGVIFGAFSLCG